MKRWGISVTVALCAAALSVACTPPRGIGTVPASAGNGDALLQKCGELLQRLKSSQPESAERDFDENMRVALPPAALQTVWRNLELKNGEFVSWRLLSMDTTGASERRVLELTFRRGVMSGIVAFDRTKHEIIGLFFRTIEGHSNNGSVTMEGPKVRSVEQTIGEGPFVLPGTLALPDGPHDAKLPGVVLVPGSGPQDRDETLGPLKPFADLANGLAQRNIAVLRYDKRTFARPHSIDSRRVTVDDEVIVDAIAAIRKLRSVSEVDDRCVFVLGHSLGALLAPEIATRAGGIAGLVLAAAPGRPVLEVILDQIRLSGASPAEVSRIERKIEGLSTLPGDEVVLGAPASYWRDLAARDPFGMTRRLGGPVLLIRGDRDRNVLALDQEIWEREIAGVRGLKSVTVRGVNHALMRVTEGGVSSSHVPADMVEVIAAFVKEHAATAGESAR